MGAISAGEHSDSEKSWLGRPIIWFGLMVAVSVPFLLAAFPPTPDYYNHVGRLYVMLHADDPGLVRYYSFHWRLIGNLGADLASAALSPLAGLEFASRIVFGSVPALCAAGVLALSRAAHGRVEPTVLLALPLIYSFSLSYGFINYSLAMALAFVLAAIWMELRARPARQAIFAALAAPVLWICHFAGFGIFLVILGAASLCWAAVEHRRLAPILWSSARRVLPAYWPLLLTLLWRSGTSHEAASSASN